jgi:hypothetical protein
MPYGNDVQVHVHHECIENDKTTMILLTTDNSDDELE